MRARDALALAGLALAAFGPGCGTVYQPAPSPRIGVVMRGGGPWYVKDGRETPVGPLGGDLEALVARDADAVRFARRARHDLAVGVPAYVCGAAAIIVGLFVSKPAGWIVAGSGVAAAGVGLGLMGAGVANAVDAVNVFNDQSATPRP